MSAVKVLICERETKIHDRLKAGFTQIFEFKGRTADVRACDSIDSAHDLLAGSSFDVLVTDLQFAKDMAVGLDFIKIVKTDFPELFVIACSNGNPGAEELRNNQPTYDSFVPKRWLTAESPEDIKRVGNEIDRNFRRLTQFELRIAERRSADILVQRETVDTKVLKSLAAQAYADLDKLDSRFRPKAIEVTPITGGFSGSLVLQVRLIADNPDLRFVRTVLKVSPKKWARQERDNFNSFAKWMLPFTKRTELVGYGETKEYGAVAYAFVMGGEEPFTSLTDHIEARSLEKIESFISKIFDNEQVSFYQNTRETSIKTAPQHYRARYFSDDKFERNRKTFREVVTTSLRGTHESDQYTVDGKSYPDPFLVLFTHETRRYTVSVCHGDLNSNNILCSENGSVAYIDFQDTGPGHLLQDFAALEHSIRLTWNASPARSSAIRTLLSRESQIAQKRIRGNGTDNYHHACHMLREYARGQFTDVEDWEYHYAACALALKLLRLPGLTNTQMNRLAACALVSAAALEDG